jgi:leader peptidase (prepilin peptidase)/N-methyltransferase
VFIILQPLTLMPSVFVFIFGTFIGSFLNVCIARIPDGKSIVKPPSHCPNCLKTIPFYDNIPLLSYLALMGKCRFCKTRISLRYFMVELLTGILFLFLYLNYGLNAKFFVYNVLFSSLIVATFIDLKYQIIPDVISISGIFMGFVLSVIFPSLRYVLSSKVAAFDSLLGIFIGGALIWLTGAFGKLLFKKEAMGFGDVKLMAMLGAFLGWKKIVLTFFLAPFFGLIFGIISLIKTKSHYIPYGPFISLAAFIAAVWGENIWMFIGGCLLYGK